MSVSTDKQTKVNIQQSDFVHEYKSKLSTDYKIVKKLGAGAFSEVFLIQNRVTNNLECAKIIERSSLSSFENEDIMNEIKTLADMDHPNIMKIKGYYQTNNHIYIISEYLSGGELFDRIIEAHNFTESQAARLIDQILSAVSYLHKHNIIHRDLKPENIVFECKDKDALLKIIDFGTSKKVAKNEKLKSRLGTAYYIAPEVLGQNYDMKCDVWSCGVILYVFLFGIPPFNGKTDEDIFDKIKKGVFKFPEGQKVSEEAKKLITKMLTKSPDQRPTADALLKEPWFVKMREKSSDLESNVLVMKNLQDFKSKYEFQKAILLYFVNFFDIKEEKTRLYKVFKSMDKDGDGQLDKAEMKEAFSKNVKGVGNADDDINAIFDKIDVNHTGQIDFSEFLLATFDYKRGIHEKELRQIFSIIDKDKSGTLDKNEIGEFFNLSGPGKAKELELLMNDADTNKDGLISLDEFFGVMNAFLKTSN